MSLELETITNYEKVSVMNANFEAIVDEFLNKLDRVSSDDDNSMNQDLDLNGYQILNAIIDDSTYQATMDEYVSNAETTIDDYVENTSKPAIDTYTDLAQQWASEDEDVLVDDTDYSAKHYAAKAAASAALFNSIDVELTGDVTGTGTLDTDTGVIEVETTSSDNLTYKPTGHAYLPPPTPSDWSVTGDYTQFSTEYSFVGLYNQENSTTASTAYADFSSEMGDGTTDWTVIAKVEVSVPYQDSAYVVFGPRTSSNNTVYGVGPFYSGYIGLKSYVDNSPVASLSTTGNDIIVDGQPTILHFKVTYDASTEQLSYYYSADGLVWIDLYTGYDKSTLFSTEDIDSLAICAYSDGVDEENVVSIKLMGLSWSESLEEEYTPYREGNS